jgi:hypothetical protein
MPLIRDKNCWPIFSWIDKRKTIKGLVSLEARTLGGQRLSFVFALPAGNASTNKWQRDAAIA